MEKGNPRGALVVTGASRGIGAAIARLAGKHGYAVAVNFSADEAGAASVTGDIISAGGRAKAFRADIAMESDVLRLFDEAERELGPLRGLVNNAGITAGSYRVDTITLEALQRVFAVNVFGAFLCAREAVRRMSTQRGGPGGAIVNVSSTAAQMGGAGEWVHYAATKGAIETFTVGLAREVAAEGIRVNAVAPGIIETTIHAPGGGPDRLQRMKSAVPMQRIGTPQEVAEAVLWLLSPAPSYTTGAILAIGGGRF